MGWFQDTWDSIRGKTAAERAQNQQQQALNDSKKAQTDALKEILRAEGNRRTTNRAELDGYEIKAKDLANTYSDRIANSQLNAYSGQKRTLLGTKEDYKDSMGGAANAFAGNIKDATAEANMATSAAAEQYKETMSPFTESGKIAEVSLAEMIENPMEWLKKDPGYQARMDQGMNAVQNSAAARGMLDSGKTLKDLQRFGQDYASQEFDKAFNRTLSLADRGRQITQEIASMDFDVANLNSSRNLEAANTVAGMQMEVTSDIARMSASIDEALAAGEIEKADKMSELMMKTQGILQGIAATYLDMNKRIDDQFYNSQIEVQKLNAGLQSDAAVAQAQIAQQYAQNRSAGMSSLIGGATNLFGLF